MMKLFANTMVVIILHYMRISNQHVVHLNSHSIIFQLYLNKAGEQKQWGSFKPKKQKSIIAEIKVNCFKIHLIVFIISKHSKPNTQKQRNKLTNKSH